MCLTMIVATLYSPKMDITNMNAGTIKRPRGLMERTIGKVFKHLPDEKQQKTSSDFLQTLSIGFLLLLLAVAPAVVITFYHVLVIDHSEIASTVPCWATVTVSGHDAKLNQCTV